MLMVLMFVPYMAFVLSMLNKVSSRVLNLSTVSFVCYACPLYVVRLDMCRLEHLVISVISVSLLKHCGRRMFSRNVIILKFALQKSEHIHTLLLAQL